MRSIEKHRNGRVGRPTEGARIPFLFPPFPTVEIKSGPNPSLFGPFEGRVICGDDSRIKRGKPHPDIFLLAARDALECEGIRDVGEEHDAKSGGREGNILVFEDAKPGVQAALAAGMKVVWVPDPNVGTTGTQDWSSQWLTQVHIVLSLPLIDSFRR